MNSYQPILTPANKIPPPPRPNPPKGGSGVPAHENDENFYKFLLMFKWLARTGKED